MAPWQLPRLRWSEVAGGGPVVDEYLQCGFWANSYSACKVEFVVGDIAGEGSQLCLGLRVEALVLSVSSITRILACEVNAPFEEAVDQKVAELFNMLMRLLLDSQVML